MRYATLGLVLTGLIALALGCGSLSQGGGPALNQGNGEIGAEALVTILGHVHNIRQQKPLEGALITVQGTTIQTTSDASGNFTLENVPEFRKLLRVTKAGYLPTNRYLTNRQPGEFIHVRMYTLTQLQRQLAGVGMNFNASKGQVLVHTFNAEANQFYLGATLTHTRPFRGLTVYANVAGNLDRNATETGNNATGILNLPPDVYTFDLSDAGTAFESISMKAFANEISEGHVHEIP